MTTPQLALSHECKKKKKKKERDNEREWAVDQKSVKAFRLSAMLDRQKDFF